MVNIQIATEIEIHEAFRLVTAQALRNNSKLIEDAGAGMTNVYMDVLGYDNSIVQCYPNGEYDCVYIVIPKNAEEHSIEIGELPEFLQEEVFDAYRKHLYVPLTTLIGNGTKTKTNQDATISIVDYKGEKWVRVEALGEDFIIAPRDLDDSKEFDYDGAMARLKELGLDTFNRKQGFIIATYADEINAKLKEIGGDPMDKYCYVSKELWKPAGSVGEYFSNYSWYFYGNSRSLNTINRYYSSFRSRPCSAYSVKND